MADVNADQAQSEGTVEEHGFEAEVAKLLRLMVHSVYSEREIFLRELISNAADACDKLRYEAISTPNLLGEQTDFRIDLSLDPEAKTLTLADNGIGMSKADLIENLGTIARSGTEGFMDRLTGDAKADVQLIGQFGVGFYSVFMVADRVEVLSRRAGDEAAHIWASEGTGKYTVTPAEKEARGTTIVLHLKDDADEYLDRFRLESIIRKYSDHIAHPIFLAPSDEADEDTEEPKSINDGSALWTRPKSEITEENYTEFYRHASHAFDAPAFTLHYKAEGMQEYTVLLFIPETQPMDLFDPARKNRVKLFVKRVFIADDTSEVLPGWLRFLRGVIDSQDLPLNISREMLQNNPTLERMAKAITKKVLGELEKLSTKDTEKYEAIWSAFGPVLKEGLYEDFERRDALLKLARFRTTGSDGWTSLADYVSRMKDKQSDIYFVTGTDKDTVTKSPQLEGFRAKGIEVLLLSDPVDDFWLQSVSDYEGKPFKSVTKSGTDLKDIAGEDASEDKSEDDKADDVAVTALSGVMKEILGDQIKEVRVSDRLVDTPACLVADDAAMDMHLERMLKAHNQIDALSAKILEVNPSHPLIKAMTKGAAEANATDALSDAAWLLYDQARILEGEAPVDATEFARRLSSVLTSKI